MCNPGNATCVKGKDGSYDRKEDCEAQCKSVPVPIDLVGTWRGLQINKQYVVGEWRAVFTQTNVTVTRPDNVKFSGGISLVGIYITIDPVDGPLKGKTIQTLWQVQFGPETKELTWAWGAPGGSPPKSYESAMIDQNNAEFVFVACLDGKQGVCNFNL